MSPKIVLEMFSSQLSPYEKDEIHSYLNIYFISDMDHKLPLSNEKEFDDERLNSLFLTRNIKGFL